MKTNLFKKRNIPSTAISFSAWDSTTTWGVSSFFTEEALKALFPSPHLPSVFLSLLSLSPFLPFFFLELLTSAGVPVFLLLLIHKGDESSSSFSGRSFWMIGSGDRSKSMMLIGEIPVPSPPWVKSERLAILLAFCLLIWRSNLDCEEAGESTAGELPGGPTRLCTLMQAVISLVRARLKTLCIIRPSINREKNRRLRIHISLNSRPSKVSRKATSFPHTSFRVAY